MNDPTLAIALVVFVVSCTIVIIRERSRVHPVPVPVLMPAAAATPEEHKSFTSATMRAAPTDAYLEREIDKLREEQVRLRIEIDRLKRPMGTAAEG